MNQTFSLSRFQLLIKLDLAEKGKNYLLMALLLVGLMVLLMFPVTWTKEYTPILSLFHPLALFMVVIFGGSLYTSQIFNHYASADTGIAAIMLPASRLEKYLSALLLNLLFTVPFLLLFLKLHFWTTDLANSKLNDGSYHYNYIPADLLEYFVSLHIIIQGSIFLGSVYFTKLSYIKTAAVLFITIIFAACLNLALAYYLTGFPSKVVTFPFSLWKIWFYESNTNYAVTFPEQIQFLVYAFPALFLLCFWYIAYIRLKEKEI